MPWAVPRGISPDTKKKADEARPTAQTIGKRRSHVDVPKLTTATVDVDTPHRPGLYEFLRLERHPTTEGKTKESVQYVVTM